MNNTILGLHHITAISREPLRNYRFYTRALGLRLVLQTVAHNDPSTLRLYYGDENASPGSIVSFLILPRIHHGYPGAGVAKGLSFRVASGSSLHWDSEMKSKGVPFVNRIVKFGEEVLEMKDPDGLAFELTGFDNTPAADHATGIKVQRLDSITLGIKSVTAVSDLLADIFGYRFSGREGNRHRFQTAVPGAESKIDLLEISKLQKYEIGGGNIVRIAFRATTPEALTEIREKIAAKGFNPTTIIDQQYYRSFSFNGPDEILIKVATDLPGFAAGNSNKPEEEIALPALYEPRRAEIESALLTKLS